jgi:hypothetical protein
MGTASGFPNGRVLAKTANTEDDVTDTLLTVILSKGAIAVSDGVDRNDKNYLTGFPWLGLPWRGFDQGHGKPTP